MRRRTADLPAGVGPRDGVVLFDGVCNLCNGAVQFLLARAPRGTLRFAALQSEAGRAILAWAGLACADGDTMVFLERGKVYTRSTAVLRIARHLRRPWCWLAAALAVPAPLRDWFYDRLARSRYRLFGRREECMLPRPELLRRFL
jgi:predicted DCC family thiol-disulfide oxidoreductase YuxK